MSERMGGRRWWKRMAIAGAVLIAAAPAGVVRAEPPAVPAASKQDSAPAKAGAKARVVSERWYVVLMGAEKAGHAHEIERIDEKGRTVSEQTLRFKIGRLGQAIEMRIGSTFIETAAGEPVEMISDQDLGLSTVKESYRFVGGAGGGVIRVTESGGRTTSKPADRPAGEWMTPGAARRYVETKLAEGAKEISVRVLDPTAGLTPVEQTQKVVGPANVEVMGKTVPAIEWIVTQSVMPGVETREFVDKRGVSVRTQIELGGLRMTMLESEKELALSPFAPPEMMQSTLVRPSRPIEGARTATRGVYVLRSAGKSAPEVATGSVQTARPQADGSVRVTVDLKHAGAAAPEGDARDERYTRGSAMVDIDDPAVAELAERALEGTAPGATAERRAELLRKFVRSYISTKGLGVGFASASEVCATREGDCSEHGVLLAALLRANGIPSRVVSGLVYVDSFVGERRVFGYHMWTQALLVGEDGVARWVDLDATLSPEAAFDATHIAISVSGLGDGEIVNSMAAMASSLGELKIEVVEVE